MVAGVAAWVAAGCTVPFGPGYIIEKQRIEVTYSQSAPDRVSVRAWYRMKNTGTQPLEEIHFQLPYKDRADNLRLDWGGQALTSKNVPGAEVEFSAQFSAPWTRKDRRELVLSYDLRIADTSHSLGEGHGPFFFFPSGGWYPYLLPPRGSLSEGGAPPDEWDLVVSVPEAYQVHASGTQRGQGRSGNRDNANTSYRFEQKSATDFDPFVVAVPFSDQHVYQGNERVHLWVEIASDNESRSYQLKALARSNEFGEYLYLGQESIYFNTEFGPQETARGEVWMIDCPGGATVGYDQPGRFRMVAPDKRWEPIADCLTLPQTVVAPVSSGSLDPPGSFVAPIHEDANKEKDHPIPSLDVQLAATWFPFAVHDAPGGPWFPMSGTPDYMAVAFTIMKNPSKRGDYIRQLIGRVDSDPEGAKNALASTKKIEDARIRSELFFLALEDRCGAPNVHHALARILRILRGGTWGVNDLRSAMEAECGADLAEFFRQWLNRPGIPDEFRARYIGTPAAKPASGGH